MSGRGTAWQTQIDVRDFIQHNYTPYEGDESFLAPAHIVDGSDYGRRSLMKACWM
ncbi:hypothetical protein, partial [Klebsiella variicola]|uniref:hypothetical protein n=1 Tax=Klebsiella variicola TaxID=244366 RepID=UPI00387E0AD1